MFDFIFLIKAIAIALLVLAIVSLLPLIQQIRPYQRILSLCTATFLALTILAIASGFHFIGWPMNLIWLCILIVLFILLSSFSRKLKFRYLRMSVIVMASLPCVASIVVFCLAPFMFLLATAVLNAGTTKYVAVASKQNLICEVTYHPGFAAPGFTTIALERRWSILPFLQQEAARSIFADEELRGPIEVVCNELAAKA